MKRSRTRDGNVKCRTPSKHAGGGRVKVEEQQTRSFQSCLQSAVAVVSLLERLLLVCIVTVIPESASTCAPPSWNRRMTSASGRNLPKRRFSLSEIFGGGGRGGGWRFSAKPELITYQLFSAERMNAPALLSLPRHARRISWNRKCARAVLLSQITREPAARKP